MIFESVDLVALGIVTTFLAVVALIVHLESGRHRELLGNIAAALNGKVEKQMVAGLHEGNRFEAHLLSRSRHPSVLRLRMPVAIPGDLSIVRNDRLERLSGKAGLVSPITSGDAAFDSQYATTSTYPGLAERFLQDESTRETIASLFGLGIQSVMLSGKAQSIMLLWDPAADFFDQPREGLRQVAGLLGRLKAAVPKLPFDARFADDPHSSNAFAALIMLELAMFAFGGFAAMYAEVYYQPLDRGGLFGLAGAFSMPVLFLFLHQARKWLRGHLQANRHFIALAITGMLAFPVASYALALMVNGALDDSVPLGKEYLVLAKAKVPRSGTFDHVLTLGEMRGTVGIIELPVTSSLFDRAVAGRSQVTVFERKGKLRISWRDRDGDIVIR